MINFNPHNLDFHELEKFEFVVAQLIFLIQFKLI